LTANADEHALAAQRAGGVFVKRGNDVAMNGGDSHYWTAMPGRIGLRRRIQQKTYLSDSHKGR
jgi:hypothetical protein